ncbi:ribosome maturation factor RimM [Candidatus Blochmannia ocreatus (nom. nud.)]|uniref:Ribosome maturation factor RimM n=1 Tax=Candidatus Blochmannia ocreatus (nom. nud.) TaxID=251538 RepID=A0ABY4SWC6_9ENTR|nr:ribosome maturation factor RimM [Candidatus Blochmannia ocreatus]URJ25255.1 ribosome maturation factor RimM [Candidatus Blochmannia ocreatus]
MKKALKIPTQPVIIGKIIGAYGILGWVRIISFTEKYSDVFHYKPCFIKPKTVWMSVSLDHWKCIGKKHISKIRGISDRNSAELLNNCEIIIDNKQLPYKNSQEYYWKDIIGCTILTIQGIKLGYVSEIIETGANDVLVVKLLKNDLYTDKDCLIPFIFEKIIKNVILTENIIIVDWDPNF